MLLGRSHLRWGSGFAFGWLPSLVLLGGAGSWAQEVGPEMLPEEPLQADDRRVEQLASEAASQAAPEADFGLSSEALVASPALPPVPAASLWGPLEQIDTLLPRFAQFVAQSRDLRTAAALGGQLPPQQVQLSFPPGVEADGTVLAAVPGWVWEVPIADGLNSEGIIVPSLPTAPGLDAARRELRTNILATEASILAAQAEEQRGEHPLLESAEGLVPAIPGQANAQRAATGETPLAESVRLAAQPRWIDPKDPRLAPLHAASDSLLLGTGAVVALHIHLPDQAAKKPEGSPPSSTPSSERPLLHLAALDGGSFWPLHTPEVSQKFWQDLLQARAQRLRPTLEPGMSVALDDDGRATVLFLFDYAEGTSRVLLQCADQQYTLSLWQGQPLLTMAANLAESLEDPSKALKPVATDSSEPAVDPHAVAWQRLPEAVRQRLEAPADAIQPRAGPEAPTGQAE